MRKINYLKSPPFRTRVMTFCLTLITCMMMSVVSNAQTTLCAPLVATNNNGKVTFNFRNNNAYAIIITDIQAQGSATVASNTEAWYRPTALAYPNAAAFPVLTTANWTQFGNSTANMILNTNTSLFGGGLNLLVPAGATYGICVSVCQTASPITGSLRYNSLVAGTSYVYPDGGCDILSGGPAATNASAAGAPRLSSTSFANVPRGFLGCVTFIAAVPCAGTPTPGNTLSSSNPTCSGANFTLSLQNATSGSGVTYQWQSADDNLFTVNATNLGTSSTQATSQTAAKYYRCQVTCSGNTGTSTPVQVNMISGYTCYCPSTFPSSIEPITLVNFAGINNSTSNVVGGTPATENFTAITGTVMQGATYPFIAKGNTDGAYSSYFRVYIDFNQNGSWADAGESFDMGFITGSTGIDALQVSGNIAIPLSATPGNTFMRVLKLYNAYPASPCNAAGFGQAEDYTINIQVSSACSGTPSPGNTISSANPICSGVNFNLSLQNATLGSGVTYQWQSADNNLFTVNAVNLGTSSTQVTSQTTAKYYRCQVTCSGNTGTSTPVQVTMQTGVTCFTYCVGANNCASDYITNVNFVTINRTSTCDVFTTYTTPNPNITQGTNVPISISTGGDTEGIKVWIDWNQDGVFTNSAPELVFAPTYAGTPLAVYTGTVTVPLGATLGTTKMRVRCNYAGVPVDPCATQTWGETEDYYVSVFAAIPCTGTPATSSISITGSGACGGNTFTASGYDVTLNLVYQWESSTDNVNFFPIPSANGFTYTTTGFPSTTYYRFAVTCSNSGFTGYSNTITAAPALTPAAPVTTGDTRCGVGVVNLSATGAGTLRWFNSSSIGGPIINSGPTYNPSVTSTSTYYVFGSNSTVTQNVGLLTNAAGTVAYASATSNYQTFDVLSPNGVLINTIDFIANPATPVNTPITVTLENSSGSILGSVSTVVTAPGSLQTMTLDFFVPYGTAYRLRPSQNPNLQYHQTGFTNPYTLPGQISITGWDGGTNLYVFFYNYSVTTGCFSSVSPVTANVTTPPSLTVTPVGSSSYCGTGSVTLNAAGTGYVNFSWSPTTGLNTPSGSSVIASPTVTTTYTVTANDGSGPTGCANTATSTVTVLAKPSVIVSSSALSICKNATTTLSATGSSSSIKQFGTTESPANVTVSIYNGGNPTSRSQILMTAAELNAQGLFGPCNISSLGFQVSNKLSSGTYDGFTIGMAHTAVTSLTNTYETTTMTTVFSGNISTSLGWNTHLFTSQFAWNGTSNIVIETCFNNAGTIGFDQVYMSPTSISQFINIAFLTCTTPTGTAVLNRPNIRLTGGAVNYAWTANPDLSNLTIPNPVFTGNTLGANNFTVTVTDPANGCTGFTNYSVYVQQPKPEALSNAPVCEGLQIALIGNDTISPPTTGNSFEWSGPNGFTSLIQNPTISGASQIHAGTYTLTITDVLGCTASTTTSISIYQNPALNIVSQTNVECNGGSTGEFTIQVTNEAGFFLFDENGNINFDGIFTGYSAGNYIVQVTNGNSCESTIPVNITEADPTTTSDAGVDQSACTGTTATLAANTALVGTGSWSLVSGSGTFTSATNPATTVTGIGNGINTYRWTIDNALCSNSNFDDVNVTGTDLPTATLTGTQEICLGGSANLTITFTGTSPWLYSINGGAPVSTSTNPETVSVTPSSTTIYTITSLSDASCTGSATGSATVTVSTAPPASSCTITTLPVDACVGSTVVVSTNVVPGATSYTWSAPAGTLIEGMPSPHTTASNSVNITLGPLAANSSSWLICAFASNACGSTNTNCKPIRGSLSMPSAIVGSTVACPSTGPSNYTTTSVSGASSYLWTITGDASVSGTGLTGSVTFGPTFTTGSLCVRALLPCGYQGPTRCMTILNGTPTLGAMVGTFTVCPGTNGVAYSVPPSAGATTYNWTLPSGASIATGAGTNSITVNFGPTYTNGNVCVIATSVCGINSLPRCKTVASITPGTPGNFTTGATTGVCGQTITYNVNTVAGATGYTWTAPAGASLASANGTNTIDIAFGPGYTTGNVCVTADNSCGSGTPRCVIVKGNPSNPGVVTGLNSVCANDAGIGYSIAPVFGSTGYVWTVPSGASIVSGQGTTSIIVDWGTNGGTIGVTASGTCGTSGTKTLVVSMNCKVSSSTLAGASVNAYPNPVSTKLTIELNAINAGNYTVELMDLAGRVIYSDVITASEGINNAVIDVATYAKGVYTMRVKNSDGFAQQIRVVVE